LIEPSSTDAKAKARDVPLAIAINPEAERAHKARNTAHTALMLAGIGVLLAISSILIWGLVGALITAVAVAILYFTSPRIPPAILLRFYGARQVDASGGGQLSEIVYALAARAELEHVPQLYIIPSMMLNAFAVGTQKTAAIAITEGLLRRLETPEIAAVLAHEISHVKNNDLAVMGLADIMSRFTLALSYLAAFLAFMNIFFMITAGEAYISWLGILLLYLAPALSSLLQLGLSRAREYDADLSAARIMGNPHTLASALQKLDRHTGRFWEDLMFPVPGRRVPQPSVLRSHPTTEERIARLRQLTPQDTMPPLDLTDRPIVTLVGYGPISMRPRYRFPGLWY
jgi:heat shock protein HtpX